MGQNIISTWKQRRWEMQRNRIVCRLLEKDKHLSRVDALRMANAKMNKKKGR